MKKLMIFLVFIMFLCPVVIGESYLLKQVIEEGETQVVTINGWEYEVELVMVSDQVQKAIFKVNGEKSDILSEGESDKFSDGTSILAREILVQEGGDGRDVVQYNLYAGTKAPAPVTEIIEEKVKPKAEIPEYTAPAPKAEPVVVTEGKQETEVDVTRIVVEKKRLWERFVDWLKEIF